LAAIKLTDKSGYPDNEYTDLQTLVADVFSGVEVDPTTGSLQRSPDPNWTKGKWKGKKGRGGEDGN